MKRLNKIETVELDQVFSSRPVDRVAARVTSRGVHFDPNIEWPRGYFHSDTPLPTQPHPTNPKFQNSYWTFCGKRFGRLTVIGLSVEQRTDKKARWVVRCGCGQYETRKVNGLRAARENDWGCMICQNLKKLQGGKAAQ